MAVLTPEMNEWLAEALGVDPAVLGAAVPSKGAGSPMTNPLGTVAPYNQQGRAIRDPATNARLSEAEHIQPRAIIADQMRNPATGKSPYDSRAYRQSPTDKISRAAALDKTRGDMDAMRAQRADPTDPQAQADASLEAAIDRTLDAGERTGDASITEEGVNLAAHGQMGVMHEVGKPDVRNIFKDLSDEEIDAAVARLDEPVLAPEYAAPKGMGIPLRNSQGSEEAGLSQAGEETPAETEETASNEGTAQSATESETPELVTDPGADPTEGIADSPAAAASEEPPVKYRVAEEPPARVRVASEDSAPSSEDAPPESSSELPQPPLRRMTMPEPDGAGAGRGAQAASDPVSVEPAAPEPMNEPPAGGGAAEGGLGATAGAGLVGAAMGGATAAYGDYKKVRAGQMSVGDAAVDVGTKAAETGGLTMAGSAIARAVGTGGAEAVAGAAGAEGGAASGALSGVASAGGIIGGVVGGGMALIDDVGKVKRGEMTGGHATVDVGVKAGVGIAAGIAGAEAGAAIGAAVGSIIPGAGTAVGFVAGAVVGAGVGYVASALTETETGKEIISAAGDVVDAEIDVAKKVGSAVADEAGKAADAVSDAASAAEDALGNAGSAIESLFE
ncbi:MAG TPA: hypothetical protein VHW09_17965 [Bryobacteraceae bacterium]|jgi:hypothetical protein|nr:hypothetical protein [Bryobacteraceae bacterium]